MKYRKKPVVIEAFQFESADYDTDCPAWWSEAMNSGVAWYQGGAEPHFTIKTLEGEMRAGVGDWIIRGVKGEIYPCKPDIFDATYEAVEEAS